MTKWSGHLIDSLLINITGSSSLFLDQLSTSSQAMKNTAINNWLMKWSGHLIRFNEIERQRQSSF